MTYEEEIAAFRQDNALFITEKSDIVYNLYRCVIDLVKVGYTPTNKDRFQIHVGSSCNTFRIEVKDGDTWLCSDCGPEFSEHELVYNVVSTFSSQASDCQRSLCNVLEYFMSVAVKPLMIEMSHQVETHPVFTRWSHVMHDADTQGNVYARMVTKMMRGE